MYRMMTTLMVAPARRPTRRKPGKLALWPQSKQEVEGKKGMEFCLCSHARVLAVSLAVILRSFVVDSARHVVSWSQMKESRRSEVHENRY